MGQEQGIDMLKMFTMESILKSCHVIRRDQWGAKPPKDTLDFDWHYDSIVVHYTGHDNLLSMRSIQDFDVNHQHWSDVSYHYAVSRGGQIFEGRQLVYKGAHVKLQNTGKIGIVCMGDFDPGLRSLLGGDGWNGDPVESAMLASLERLSRALMRVFPIKVFGGHREFGDTEVCPGSSLLPAVTAMRERFKLAAPVHRSL